MAYARAKVFRNPTITIATVAYSNQVNKARLVPDTPIQTMRTFSGVDQDRDTTSWTFEMSGHQDRGSGGLADALDDAAAAGVAIEVIVEAAAADGNDMATFDIIPVPVEFGGEQGQWKLFDAEFAVVDQPVFAQTTT